MRLYPMILGVIRGLGVPVAGYLIQTDDGDNVLVDSGASPDDRIEVREEHDLLRQLAVLGVRPADVRYLVCSHFDPDHVGNHGAFPAAEFVVQRDHYELARSDSVPRLAQARRYWDVPGLRYRMVSGDTTLLPGIELVESSGHVCGHQSVLVRLVNTGPVLLAIDAIPMAGALDPEQRPVFPFDLDPKELRRSTRKLVELARAEQAMIVHGHDTAQWASLRTVPDYYD